MTSVLLLLLASAASPVPAARLQVVASARIVAGERIAFREASAGQEGASRRMYRTTAAAVTEEFRLVEFQ